MAAGGLTKKMGPLPVWAWGLILGVAGYYVFSRYKSNATSTAATTASPAVLDPNAIDPNTGLTYGQEEAAALNGSASSNALNGLSNPYGTTTGSNLQTGTNELADLGSFLTNFGTLAQQMGYTPPGSTVPSSSVSATTAAAAGSPAITAGASPPTSSASSHIATLGPAPAASAIDRLNQQLLGRSVVTIAPTSGRSTTTAVVQGATLHKGIPTRQSKQKAKKK